MPYILNKTDGTQITIVQDASLDLTTDLIFVGRNYAGYGEWQNENFLKLLENFSNTIPPSKPIDGQLWYDTTNKRLNVFDGANWKSISNLDVATENPNNTKIYESGDLWFDSREEQLYAYNGENFVLIGPPSGADTRAQWKGDVEYAQEDTGTPKYNIKAILGANDEVVAMVSAETYTVAQADQPPLPKYPIYDSGTPSTISKGITLKGANYLTGESASQGIYFWGSARHAVNANTATTAIGFVTNIPPSTGTFPIPFTTGTTYTKTDAIYTTSSFYYNPFDKSVKADIFKGVATSAYYADIAERYAADAVYEFGTVLMLGGEQEVTLATLQATTTVAGVVSKNPAYMMNSEAGTDETHPYIALKGRVPCKICGPVKKGDLLVTSGYKPGYATKKQDHDSSDAVIGKALEDFEGSFGIIEIKV
jgi:hypothetical protein